MRRRVPNLAAHTICSLMEADGPPAAVRRRWPPTSTIAAPRRGVSAGPSASDVGCRVSGVGIDLADSRPGPRHAAMGDLDGLPFHVERSPLREVREGYRGRAAACAPRHRAPGVGGRESHSSIPAPAPRHAAIGPRRPTVPRGTFAAPGGLGRFPRHRHRVGAGPMGLGCRMSKLAFAASRPGATTRDPGPRWLPFHVEHSRLREVWEDCRDRSHRPRQPIVPRGTLSGRNTRASHCITLRMG